MTYGKQTNQSALHVHSLPNKIDVCILYVIHVVIEYTEFSVSIPLLLFPRNACEKIWGEELKDLIEDRGRRGKQPYYKLYNVIEGTFLLQGFIQDFSSEGEIIACSILLSKTRGSRGMLLEESLRPLRLLLRPHTQTKGMFLTIASTRYTCLTQNKGVVVMELDHSRGHSYNIIAIDLVPCYFWGLSKSAVMKCVAVVAIY